MVSSRAGWIGLGELTWSDLQIGGDLVASGQVDHLSSSPAYLDHYPKFYRFVPRQSREVFVISRFVFGKSSHNGIWLF